MAIVEGHRGQGQSSLGSMSKSTWVKVSLLLMILAGGVLGGLITSTSF